MNSPAVVTQKAYRNDSYQQTISILDGSGSPISLATADVKMQIRNYPDGDVLQSLTQGNGITVGGANNNVITISKIISIQVGGKYYYDLQATFADGTVQTYLRGQFIVTEDITQ